MPPFVIALWCVGLAAKALAAFRIVRKGFFHRLPIFWAYILISVARSATMLAFVGDRRRYASIGADSMPMVLISEAFAITSVFWLVTENFPRWRRTGTISLATLALIGAAVSLLVRGTWVPKDWGYTWAQIWEAALLMQRHAMLGMVVVLAGVRFLLALVRVVPVSPLARRAADVLLIDVSLGFFISLITIQFLRGHALAYYLPVLAGIANGCLWAFWLPAAVDVRYPAKWPWWQEEEESIDWRACIHDLIGRIRQPFTAKP